MKPSSHPALALLDGEQIAELALLGLKYRTRGAAPFNFKVPEELSPYWTADRLAEAAIESAQEKGPLQGTHVDRAQGVIGTLLNVHLISGEAYDDYCRRAYSLACTEARQIPEVPR